MRRLRTPAQVQRWLNALPYNVEKGSETLRSFRGVVRTHSAHCLEATLLAAVVLEQHGYPPLVMSLESQDLLDHVIFVYRAREGWGSVARSRDPGLHGRRPVFRSIRALAQSYVEPYIDYTGRVKGYGVAHLAEAMGRYDWRWSSGNVWKVEQMLIDWPHVRLLSSTRRYRLLRQKYRKYRTDHHDRKPVYYRGREKWTPIPDEFRDPP
ncbi:MAG: hypothetical protein IT180_01305 [Acidobacteria bacterium]|nr:hypothetical protein [Acidobacteriota bacterium]